MIKQAAPKVPADAVNAALVVYPRDQMRSIEPLRNLPETTDKTSGRSPVRFSRENITDRIVQFLNQDFLRGSAD